MTRLDIGVVLAVVGAGLTAGFTAARRASQIEAMENSKIVVPVPDKKQPSEEVKAPRLQGAEPSAAPKPSPHDPSTNGGEGDPRYAEGSAAPPPGSVAASGIPPVTPVSFDGIKRGLLEMTEAERRFTEALRKAITPAKRLESDKAVPKPEVTPPSVPDW